MASSPSLFRSQSIDSSRFISRAMWHKTHCSQETHRNNIHKIWCWVAKQIVNMLIPLVQRYHNSSGTGSSFITCTLSALSNMTRWGVRQAHTQCKWYFLPEDFHLFSWYARVLLILCRSAIRPKWTRWGRGAGAGGGEVYWTEWGTNG